MELTATTTTVNTLLFPTTPRSRNPITIPLKRPNLFDVHPAYSSNPRNPHKNPIFLTYCSTKPTISDDRDNVIKDQDSTISSNSNFNIQNPQKPNSNQEKSSSNSSVSRGLVLDLGSESSWDSIEVGSPVVKRFLSDEEERWYMWYHGRSGGNLDPGSIGLAVSSNGIHWERGKGVVQSGSDVGLVLKSSNDWWAFDTNGVMPGEIVIMSSSKIRASNAVYWLYYTGFSNEKIEFSDNSLEFSLENGGFGKICRSLPGLAMSQDGRHWARIEGEHHSGSLFDLGSQGEWDSMFIASPQTVFHSSGDLRMYYHSFDLEKGHFGIGMARSRDGLGLTCTCKMSETNEGSKDLNLVDNDPKVEVNDEVSTEEVPKHLEKVEGNPMPSPAQEEAVIKKKYGGLLPRKTPLISKDHDRAFFDSADWALGKGSQKSKGPLEALRPKLQPTPHQQARSRRSAYAPADEGEVDDGSPNLSASDDQGSELDLTNDNKSHFEDENHAN